MLANVPAKFRKRTAKPNLPAKPALAPLTLVSASYESTVSLTLTFNRAIDVSAIAGSAIVVDDGIIGFRYAGTGGATLLSATVLELLLEGVEELPFVGVHLSATSANGIVALGDGAPWAGATDVALPFP
jgi:hypothetical protein